MLLSIPGSKAFQQLFIFSGGLHVTETDNGNHPIHVFESKANHYLMYCHANHGCLSLRLQGCMLSELSNAFSQLVVLVRSQRTPGYAGTQISNAGAAAGDCSCSLMLP